MLATKSEGLPDGDWWLEPKWNGYRVVAGHHQTDEDSAVWLEIRGGTRIGNLPYLQGTIGLETPVDTILDCELVSDLGWGHVQSVVKRHATHQPTPRSPALWLAVFDLMVLDGDDLRGEPLVDRREALEGLARTWTTDRLKLTPRFPVKPEVYGKCIELGFEGVVAKRWTARYQPGKRVPHQLKIKAVDSDEAVITRFYDPEPGSWLEGEGLIGAYGFGFYDPDTDKVAEVGKAGTGMTRSERRAVEAAGINAVVEFGFSARLESGSFLHPTHLRIRKDKHYTEVRQPEGEAMPTDLPGGGQRFKPPTTRPDVEGAPESPVRSGTGRIRNVGAMKDAKLLALSVEMADFTDSDPEGYNAVQAEVEARGL
jgi:bifunctional non-homologous end joining protein LigD